MSTVDNRILVKMLDRLFAAMVNGPSLNCRPHSSRQRLDLTHVARLHDLSAEEVIRGLLGPECGVKLTARVPPPRRPGDAKEQRDASDADRTGNDPEPPPTEAERAAQQAWSEQQSLLNKFRIIVDDARTYEQDTGVNVLSVGFPLLSLPPAVLGSKSRGQTRRIVAPIAFIPAALIVKTGPNASIQLDCKGEGTDRVMPNAALLAWLEQQSGRDIAELFADEHGEQPWREICELVLQVAGLLDLAVPEVFSLSPPSTSSAATDKDQVPDAPIPASLSLSAAPRADESDAAARIIPSAVLGLFPMSNQGLLRDTQAMIAGEPLVGPVESFVHLDASLDAPVEPRPESRIDGDTRPRVFTDERLVTSADPCQLRAVRLARESQGLVIHGPPGTGKSQTITNIIGDHLARGQRVLFVCDKRTALDVVAHRLDHMGIGRLCALIHDPQRDQRELYKSVREQLDDLAEAPTPSAAEKQLAKVDAELQRVYVELTATHTALSQPDGEHGASFHDLVGDWLAISCGEGKLDDARVTGITLTMLDQKQQELHEILHRAADVAYATNPWVAGHGVDARDFLSRPVEPFRTALDACASAANQADATADPDIPAFSAIVDLAQQARARTDFARRMRSVLERVSAHVRSAWARRDAQAIRRARQKLTESGAVIEALRSGPLDTELLMTVQSALPDMPALAGQLGALEAYLPIADQWYGALCFKRKSQAAAVITRYGLPPGALTARRLRNFLVGLRARLVLKQLHDELLGYAPTPGLVEDERLDRTLSEPAELFDLVASLIADPALAGLLEPVQSALCDATREAQLLGGLDQSTARADSLARLEHALSASKLFNSAWLTALQRELRGGARAAPTLAGLHDRFDTLEGVLRIQTLRAEMPPPLRNALDALLPSGLCAETGMAALRKAVLSGEIARRLRSDPQLAAVDAQRIQSRFERYRQLDEQKQALVRDVILHRWISRQKERLLASTGSRLNSLGADVRRRLMMRGERAMRLRQVIAIGAGVEGGDPLFDLRPVWMASPETVAQLFPRNPLFDVVVFDEASQCRLEEALPVLTRGQRVVIAGDPKQLPPTRFFESAITVSEDEEIESDQQLFELQQGEIEDLLGAALNLSIQQCYLDVHYRSRNADLIGFSNQQFYGLRLQAIPGHPANRTRFAPLVLYRVNGVYQDRCNEIEAEQVGRIVRDLLKRAAPPSIGVACFNLQQRDLVVEKLDALAMDDPEFGRRLAEARIRKGAGSFEGLFVKNLENVQGDERDHVIISTTYGPDPKGRFYRRFGPLGRAGGGRRLNVLVTRAREEVHLVTSIPPEVYRNLPPIPKGQTPGGGWLLFAYLAYAEQLAALYEQAGAETEPTQTMTTTPRVIIRPSKAPSRFAQALAQRLADAHKVGSDVHWGNDGFCVDLALHHPRQPEDVTLGILCDGARFAPAADPVEWDLFRTTIHESQGWQLHRIWTPHFFRNPEAAIRSILRQASSLAAQVQAKDALPVVNSRPGASI